MKKNRLQWLLIATMTMMLLPVMAIATPSTLSDEDFIITFTDSKVKALCVANWDTNDDGELSKDESATRAFDACLSLF